MGSEKKEADLIVYEDASHTKPAIIVEAKARSYAS
jgi:type I restriction enzyme M protein